MVSIALICVWLTVRFPYEAESGLEHLLNGPNRVNPQTLHLRGEFVESNLGPIEDPGGGVTVRMIAEQYFFAAVCSGADREFVIAAGFRRRSGLLLDDAKCAGSAG